MRYASLRVMVIALVVSSAAARGADAEAAVACGMAPAFEQSTEGGDRPVRRSDDGALFYTGPLAINYDGAPNAYHPLGRERGEALDTICNGANAILPGGAKLRGYSQCGAFYAAFEQARDAGWVAPGEPRIEWYGVASEAASGDGRWRPCVQGAGPFAGYFVAQTALLADPSKGRCDPARYVDSTRLPFVVLPGKSRFQGLGMALGDVVLAFYPRSGRLVPAIVGDIGPPRKLGEGSLALARALRGEDPSAPAPPSAFAKAAIAGGVTVVMFPGARVEPPITPERIEAAARERFERWGGAERLKACAKGG